MTQRCAYCQDDPKLSRRRRTFHNDKSLAQHTADAHPGKEPKQFKRKRIERDPSIAEQSIDAMMARNCGEPMGEYDNWLADMAEGR